jgi:type IV pilus assembly protein PilE
MNPARQPRHPSRQPARRSRGFTLIELVLAVVIIGMLMAVAYPAFNDSIRKGRRSEAFSALAQLQQAQERFRSNNPQYAASPTALSLPATTASGRYTIAVENQNQVGYDVIATAATGSSQVNDSTCAKLGVRVVRGSVTYASCTGCANTALSWGPGDNCWKR